MGFDGSCDLQGILTEESVGFDGSWDLLAKEPMVPGGLQWGLGEESTTRASTPCADDKLTVGALRKHPYKGNHSLGALI